MSAENNSELSTETATALLNAIKEAAPGAQNRSVDGLKSLAEAYSLVAGAMPRKPGTGRSITS